MNPGDRATTNLAARIADGSAIDWEAAESITDPGDRPIVDELRTIATIAAIHRAPSSGNDERAPASTTWGALTILEPIGTGRFGDVYLAWDARLHRRAALKLLRVASSRLAEPTRAIEEARLLARVRHPNVLTVYGAEYVDGQVGIWTEFIEGQTLEARLKEAGSFDAEAVTDIGIALARALSAVHDAGLLHRDIKAQNVMRETGGRIVLMDFGAGHDLTLAPARHGDLTGTPLLYLAPEVLAGGPASPSSDVYALGVLLFRLLTGTHPVAGHTLQDVRIGHEKFARRRLGDIQPDLPRALVAAIERAIAHEPRNRFSDATAFARALDETRSPHDSSVSQRHESDLRTRYRFIALAGLTASAVVAALTFLWSATPAWPEDLDAAPPVPAAIPLSAVETRLTPEGISGIRLVGRPSRDGRVLPYASTDGDVWFWDPARNLPARVVDVKPGEFAEFTLASPNGTRVAYTVSTPQGSTMRVANADGTDDRELITAEAAAEPEPLDWSRDGRSILTLLAQTDGSASLVLVNDQGGPTVIQQFAGGALPGNASLSPDGQFVVYDQPKPAASGKRELVIARTDGTPGRVLLPGPASYLLPLWLADGQHIFFVSDRAATIDGWVVAVDGTGATGSPVRVAERLNHIVPLGVTDDGRFYFLLRTNGTDVYTVAIDGGTARPETLGRVSQVAGGARIAPGWSPRGDLISYLTISSATVLSSEAHVLTIQEIATGRKGLVPADMNRIGLMAPRWSPDGTRMLLRGEGRNGRVGYWHVNLATGAATPILFTPPNDINDYGAFAWAPDGQRIFYLHAPRGVIARDLRTGNETVVIARGTRVPRWSILVSPDGQRIAFTTHLGRSSFIETADLDGSNRRDVAALNPPAATAILQGWSPDDRLVYTTGFGGADLPARVWSIPASGGVPQDMRLSVNSDVRQNKLALSPDGRTLAYTEGVVSRELWMMDGFLPGDRGGR